MGNYRLAARARSPHATAPGPDRSQPGSPRDLVVSVFAHAAPFGARVRIAAWRRRVDLRSSRSALFRDWASSQAHGRAEDGQATKRLGIADGPWSRDNADARRRTSG